jgi:hypothetical protein
LWPSFTLCSPTAVSGPCWLHVLWDVLLGFIGLLIVQASYLGDNPTHVLFVGFVFGIGLRVLSGLW